MRSRSAVVLVPLLLTVVLSSCGEDEPSYTRQLCDRLEAAFEDDDGEAVEATIQAMATAEEPNPADPDTFDVPEPRIYARAFLVLQAQSEHDQDAFNFAMDDLRAECAKVE